MKIDFLPPELWVGTGAVFLAAVVVAFTLATIEGVGLSEAGVAIRALLFLEGVSRENLAALGEEAASDGWASLPQAATRGHPSV